MENLTTSLLLAGGGGLIGALLGQISQWILYSRQQNKELNSTQRAAVADFVSRVREIQQSRLDRKPPAFEGDVHYNDVYNLSLVSFTGDYEIYTGRKPITEEIKQKARKITLSKIAVEVEVERAEFFRAWDQLSLRLQNREVEDAALKIRSFMRDYNSQIDLAEGSTITPERAKSLEEFNTLLDSLVQITVRQLK